MTNRENCTCGCSRYMTALAVALGLTLVITPAVFAQSDTCVGATSLVDGDPYSVPLGQTLDPGAPAPSDGNMVDDTWYFTTASCTGTLTVETCGGGDTVLEIYSGTCGAGTLTSLDVGDDDCSLSSSTSASVTNGETIYIRLAEWNGGAALSGNITISCSAPITNGECANASAAADGDTAYDLTGDAGVDGAVVAPTDANMDNDVFFQYTATCTGELTIGTCESGAGPDTTLEVYTGCDCGTMVSAADDDDTCGAVGFASEVTISSNSGTCYTIRVGGYNASEPSGLLNIDCFVPPVGACCESGTCSNTLELDCGGVWAGAGTDCTTTSCLGSCCNGDGTCTDDINEATCTGGGGTYNGDTSVCADQICTGACCDAGSCSDEGPDNCAADFQGLGTECSTTDCPPGNDDCDGADAVSDGTTAIDNSGATDSVDRDWESDAGCTGGGHNDIWFSYTASCEGTLTIDTENSTGVTDTVMELYSSCGTETTPNEDFIACDDDGGDTPSFSSKIELEVSLGDSFLIRVGSYSSSSSGAMDLNIACVEPPETGACCTDGTCTDEFAIDCAGTFFGAGTSCVDTVCNDDCGSCENITSLPYSTSVDTSGAATGTVDPSCDVGADGPNNDVWWCHTPPSDCVAVFSVTTGYDGVTAVYSDDGTACSLTEEFCSDPNPSDAQVTLTAGTTYYFQIADWGTGDGGGSTTFDLDCIPDVGACCVSGVCSDGVAAGACAGFYAGAGSECSTTTCPPGNDDCSGATTALDGDTAYDTADATLDTGVLAPDDSNMTEDIWFVHTTTCSGDLIVGTCEGDTATTDTVLELYDGNSGCAGLTLLGTADDNCGGGSGFASEVGPVDISLGDVVYIRISGWNGGDQAGLVNIACVDSGACCNGDGTCTPNVSQATCEGGGGVYHGGGTECSSETCSGACCEAGGCTDDVIEQDCTGTYNGGGSTCAGTVCNDDCFDATEITSLPFTDTVATSNADAGPPAGSCDSNAVDTSNSVYYTYDATMDCTGIYTVATSLSGDDPILSVYTDNGTACSGLTEVACTFDGFNGGFSDEFAVISGNTYVFVIGDEGAAGGDSAVQFDFDCSNVGACCTAGACTDGVDQATCEGGGGTFAGVTSTCADTICTGACCDPASQDCKDTTPETCFYADYYCDQVALGGIGCLGDADLSGVVNASDRGFVSANIGITPADVGTLFLTLEDYYDALCSTDIDCSGVVNASDRGFVSANIGLCTPLPPCQDGSGLNFTGDGLDTRFPGFSGNFQGLGSECSTLTCPPGNDSCTDAITVGDGTTVGNNEGATDDVEVTCQFNSNGDVWFDYTSTCEGTLTIDTEGSSDPNIDDTVLAVFDSCGGTELFCDDDGGTGLLSLIEFETSIGTNYKIRVAGFSSDEGTFNLNIACTPFPTAACCNGTTCSVTTEAACTGEWLSSVPDCTGNPCQSGACCVDSAPYCVGNVKALDCVFTLGGSYLGDQTECSTVDTCPQPGACCESGACSEVFEDDCTGTFFGNATLCSTTNCPSANDDCDGAETMVSAGDVASLTYDTAGATLDGSAPTPSDTNMTEDVWYQWTATCQGTMLIDTCDSVAFLDNAGDDTVLEVYQGCDCGLLTAADSVGVGDDNGCGVSGFSSAVLTTATMSQCYTIRVSGWNGGDATGLLRAECFPDTPGACCLPDGTCDDLSALDCSIAGGAFGGEGTDCVSNPCPTGSCCLGDGSCETNTEPYCNANGGDYQGDGTDCTNDPCPTGACCSSDGSTCTDDQTAAQCAANSGNYQGDGSECSTTVCPLSDDFPAGATAIGDGTTTVDLTGATNSGFPDAVNDPCAFPFGDGDIPNDRWRTYTATCTGTLAVDTCATDTGLTSDTRIAIYDSCDAGTLGDGDVLECNDDHGNGTELDGGPSCAGSLLSSFEAPVTMGSCYFIQVGTFDDAGSADEVEVTITCTP